MDVIAGVVSELEKHGYSSEEIFKAIDLTGTTDTKALMNSMICKSKSSASMYDYSIVLCFQSIVRATFYSKIIYFSFAWRSFGTCRGYIKTKRLA